ncbi:MAG: carboxymuconolactone decarboxylase family protein [Xanthobacteraceae bacterium]
MRIPEMDFESLTPEQRKVHDAIVAGPRGGLAGPLKIWLRSPEFAGRAQDLGAFCRFNTSLPKRLSELAILITGAHWKAGFEWFVHAPVGIEAGLDREAVEAIRTGRKPTLSRMDEAALYDFARELLDTHRVSDAAYKRAEAELGIVGVVELVGILGYYGLISMTIVAFRVPIPEGRLEPFSE